MNKYRRAESRRVKRYIRAMKVLHRDVDYKAARRKVRAYKRQLTNVPNALHDSIRHMRYRVNAAVLSIRAIRESLDLANEALRTSAISDKLSMYRR